MVPKNKLKIVEDAEASLKRSEMFGKPGPLDRLGQVQPTSRAEMYSTRRLDLIRLAEAIEKNNAIMDRRNRQAEPGDNGKPSAQDARRNNAGETGGVVLRLRPPGRNSDPLYDEAYQKINAGQSPKDTFAWFCEQAIITKPDKITRDAFKAAMKRRQKKA